MGVVLYFGTIVGVVLHFWTIVSVGFSRMFFPPKHDLGVIGGKCNAWPGTWFGATFECKKTFQMLFPLTFLAKK